MRHNSRRYGKCSTFYKNAKSPTDRGQSLCFVAISIGNQSEVIFNSIGNFILKKTIFYSLRHPIIMKLHKLITSDETLASLLAQQIFSNALTTAGLVEDPRLLLTQMNELLIKVLEKH